MDKRKLLAFQLKFEGKTYSEIAKKTGYQRGTLEVYLSKEGKWYKEYLNWQDEEISSIQIESKKKLRQLTNEAIKTVEKLLRSDNENIALKAALEILKRGGIEGDNEGRGDYRYIMPPLRSTFF